MRENKVSIYIFRITRVRFGKTDFGITDKPHLVVKTRMEEYHVFILFHQNFDLMAVILYLMRHVYSHIIAMIPCKYTNI